VLFAGHFTEWYWWSATARVRWYRQERRHRVNTCFRR